MAPLTTTHAEGKAPFKIRATSENSSTNSYEIPDVTFGSART